MQAGGASEWLQALTSRLQEDNFFLLRGDNCPVMTTRGSRPGSSWADLIFAVLLGRIIDRRNALREASCQVTRPLALPWDGCRCLTPCDSAAPLLEVKEVMWADDIAIPRIVDPMEAATGVGQETRFLTEAFREFGFSLAYGPHKTAGLLTLRGKNSRRAKQAVFGPAGLKGSVPVLLERPPSVNLPLVSTYRHLGSQQAISGGLRPEIQYRISQARAAFAEGRRKVYRNPGIPVKRKALLLGSLVIPRLVFGAGAWGPLLQGEFRLFAGAVWSFYRAVLGIPRDGDQHVDSSTCFAILQLPSPAAVLRHERLTYLGQLLRSGPDTLWAILRADKEHIRLLQEDLHWLHARSWSTTGLPSPSDEWDIWRNFITTSPGKFKGVTKRARSLDVLRHVVVAALNGLYRALVQHCGLQENQPSAEAPRVLSEVCIICKRAFRDRRAWSSHAARKHGYRSHAFLCAQSTVCQGCGKLFASAGRLKRHLLSKETCVHRWGSFLPAEGSSDTPPLHPLSTPVLTPGQFVEPPQGHIRLDISTALLEQLNELDPGDEIAVWGAIESFVEPIEVLRSTVKSWRDALPASEARASTADNMLLLLDV